MAQVLELQRDTDTSAAQPPKLSFEDFLARYDGVFAEWIDGAVVMGSLASNEHQDVSRFLTMLLGFYVEARELGEIRPAPFVMRLPNVPVGREPDFMFIAQKNLHRLKPTFLDGAADLAIEIVSPESVGRDRGDKFVEYESAGVREYWIIDPQRRQAEFYFLNDDKRYELIFSGREGRVYSRVLDGFYLAVEWLWQKPMPKVAPLLKEMGVL